MDAKLNPPGLSSDAPSRLASKKIRKSVFDFIQELKEEFGKVSWTAQGELLFSTKVVIGATFLFGLGVYLFDLVIKGALDFVAVVVRLIFG